MDEPRPDAPASGADAAPPTGGPPGDGAERAGNGAIRLRRQRREPSADATPDAAAPQRSLHYTEPAPRTAAPRRAPEYRPDSQAEIYTGSKPGTRYARLMRAGDRRLERGESEGTLRATYRAETPRTATGRLWRQFKRVTIGAPLASSRLAEEKISKVKALAIFASDALSSTAYATEEILLVLVLAGTAALTYSIPISIAIAVLLVIVSTSYRQTIRAYPGGGGAYKVAMDNLGVMPGLIAGASLVVDYTLTVAVSTAAGVAAITSAIPELHDERVIMAVLFVGDPDGGQPARPARVRDDLRDPDVFLPGYLHDDDRRRSRPRRLRRHRGGASTRRGSGGRPDGHTLPDPARVLLRRDGPHRY